MNKKFFEKVSPLRFTLIIFASIISIFPFLWMVQTSFNTEQNIFTKGVF